ncbi:hypothetical protein JW926_13825 [Candidatus Sumerlaeota bacterium]|nr:hypothetical protein [Candidatus Sumerlaeota bacterium]
MYADYSWDLPPLEPLDTMIRFQRSDNNNGRAMTHEILSLIHEEKGKNSYPWTIYSHLTTHHEKGVALGVNIETKNHVQENANPLVIGLNVQAHGPEPCQIGIQVHDFEDGSYQKAIALNNKKGDVGIDIGGIYNVGIHAHNKLNPRFRGNLHRIR